MSSNTSVMTGTALKKSQSPLQTSSLDKVYEQIVNDEDLKQRSKVLRSTIKYDRDRYRHLKTHLPYFTMSLFSPPVRRADHLDAALGCILDIDYEEQLDMDTYYNVRQDPRVALSYISPSGHGFKLVFLLEQPIHDAVLYSRFYKSFSNHFAEQYRLAHVIDFQNSDATRVSFMCHDADCQINQDPFTIVAQDYGGGGDGVAVLPSDSPLPKRQQIAPDVYRDILTKLESKPRIVDRRPSISSHITLILPQIKESLGLYDIAITGHEAIQYGVRLLISKGVDQGEVNVYHGKKGYSVVASPKRGTHPQLNEVAKHIIETLLPARYR